MLHDQQRNLHQNLTSTVVLLAQNYGEILLSNIVQRGNLYWHLQYHIRTIASSPNPMLPICQRLPLSWESLMWPECHMMYKMITVRANVIKFYIKIWK